MYIWQYCRYIYDVSWTPKDINVFEMLYIYCLYNFPYGLNVRPLLHPNHTLFRNSEKTIMPKACPQRLYHNCFIKVCRCFSFFFVFVLNRELFPEQKTKTCRVFRPPLNVIQPTGAGAEPQAIFFGLGSDGTVGANKAAAAIIGERTEFYSQVPTRGKSRKRSTFEWKRVLNTFEDLSWCCCLWFCCFFEISEKSRVWKCGMIRFLGGLDVVVDTQILILFTAYYF